jgi:hypothetical protein
MPKKKTNEWNNTIKAYAKRYDISVMEGSNFKSVNKLSNDIYEYEKNNKPNNPMYPFLNVKGEYLR